MKHSLLAVVILTVIGSTAAFAGRDKAPAPKKAAVQSCCAPASKETPAKGCGMSCHETVKVKSCCK